MRARLLGPLAPALLLVGCGDPPGPAATASAGITSVSASASGDAGTATGAASDPLPTTSAATTSAATTAETPTTGALSTTSGTTTDANTASTDGSTGEVTATETSTGASASTDPDTTGTSGTTEAPCPNGQEGCPCGQNNGCDGDLVCTGGLCQPAPAPVCGNGVVEVGEQCDDGNAVNGDGCEANCTPTPGPPPDPCGFPADDGVWLEIDYSSAFTPTSPKWTYSPTPGWGEADWAPQGKSWPEAWDVFNNIEIINDQIGKVAVIGSGDALQIMFGIGGLTYDYATVCVQGRSYSVGSWVTFTVQNQLNNCGDTGMMAQDWTVHSTGVDLGTCIVQNNEFQGLRIFASGGSGALSLKRLRFTLHGAVY